MHWTTVRPDSSSISCHPWVHPVIVNVAVKHFQPLSGTWEPDVVGPIGAFVQTSHYDNVAADALDPALKRDDTILIVYMKGVEALAAESRLAVPYRNQIAGEPQMVHHGRICAVHPVPPDVVARAGIITPWLILQKLLPHEDHGN